MESIKILRIEDGKEFIMGERAYQRTGYQQEIQVIPGEYYKSYAAESPAGQFGKVKIARTARTGNTYSAMVLAKHRKEKKRRNIRRLACWAGLALVLAVSLPKAGNLLKGDKNSKIEQFLEGLETLGAGSAYPDELLEMLDKNEETYEFVSGYPNRSEYIGKEIDLTGEAQGGEVPLLLQWDQRWGYDSYGQEMIGLAGCGPTCMAMAYLHLTGDASMNPRAMAEYACENGYYTEAGTSWVFFTAGAAGLGLSGSELPLGETQIKNALDEGAVVVCSMRPGDFTTTGHFILLRGYGEGGFYVNDPNSKGNSGKQWSFERLSGQIKNLWRIGL